MEQVIDLAAWRRDHCAEQDGGWDRLCRAVDRLDNVLADRAWDRPPPWVVTELLAVQGCLSLGMEEEAAWRIERLIQRTERVRARAH